MSKKPVAKKGGKAIDTEKLTPDQILIEYIKLANVEEIEKLFEQHSDLDCNFPILEEVKKETDSRPSSKQAVRSNSSLKKNPPKKEDGDEAGDDEEPEEIEKVKVDTPLTLAVRLGFIDVARCLVDHDADLNSRAKHDENCLHIAVESFKEDEELLKFLLHLETVKFGRKIIVNRDSRNSRGETPLLVAILQYKTRAAELLIEGGAVHDFNSKSKETNLTLLQESAANGDIKLLTTLLGIGQSPFQKDHVTGRTIAHVAALYQKKETFDFMIKRKFDASFINEEDTQGNTALSITVDLQNWDLFKLLTSKLGADMHQLSSVDGSTIFHRAAYQDNKEVVEKLLSMKYKLGTLDKYGNTALHWAASSGQTDVVKSLVDKKADVNVQNNSGNTPLHNAAFVGNIETLNILLEKKAIVNKQNKHLRTPLHEAASRGHPEVIDPLVKRGGTGFIDMEDENGFTALQIAINERQIAFALELLRQGANPEREYKSYVRNEENELALLKGTKAGDVKDVLKKQKHDHATILHQAIDNGDEDLFEQLVISGASISSLDQNGRSPLHNAVSKENLAMVTVLTAKGATVDVATQDKHGFSPLIIASIKGNAELCEHLLKHQASTEFVDSQQKTALHYAARDNHLEIVKLLVENNANVSAVDSFKRTPLHEACNTNSIDVVQYLLSKDAAIELQDDHGFTPLHISVFNGSAEAAIALIEKGANLNVKDKLGRTPILVASQAGKTICGRILVQAWNDKKNGKSNFDSLYELLNKVEQDA